jgi:type I restriction enzyme M protein
VDVPGLCSVATVAQIQKQGWSLNPGRYVGLAVAENAGTDFRARLKELNKALETLNGEALVLQEQITANVRELLK